MNNDLIESIRKKVKKALSSDKNRYKHTLGVADTAACLAMRYGADIEKAYIAGLLHDCAKCVPDELKLAECAKYNLEVSDIEIESPYLLHSKLGAFYADKKYDINDLDICNAIKYHTTGRSNMTLLEEIIFVADYIEPYRNKAFDLKEVRALAFCNIKECIYVITKDTLVYLSKSGKPCDPMTKDTFEFYKNTRK